MAFGEAKTSAESPLNVAKDSDLSIATPIVHPHDIESNIAWPTDALYTFGVDGSNTYSPPPRWRSAKRCDLSELAELNYTCTHSRYVPARHPTDVFCSPNVTLTFLHTPKQPADTALFHVPLWFSKLDLRDYLFHVYDVRVLAVRSYVKQSRVQEGNVETKKPTPGRWHRPRSKKYMTVELERPFVWPEAPTDFTAWNKEEMAESTKDSEDIGKRMGREGGTIINEDRRKAMKEQAKALLEGKMKWRPMADKQSGRLLSQ